MNIKAIRWLDQNVGTLLCFLLTLHRRIRGIFRGQPVIYPKSGKILFIKLIEQGSTVLAYPALNKAVDSVGRDNVFFLVLKRNRPILDVLDLVPADNILEVNLESSWRFVSSILQAIYRVRRMRIDSALDMEGFTRASAILAYLSGAKKRVGLHQFTCAGPYRGDLLTHKLIYNPYLHTRLLFLSLVEALDRQPPPDQTPMIFEIPKATDQYPEFSPAPDQKQRLLKKIEQIINSALGKPVIILNPNIGDLLPIRKWPQEYFISLGKMLAAGFPQASIIITGTEEEKEQAQVIAAQIEGAFSLAGETSLPELLTLYCLADCLVTNDSGPAQFSALTPIKSLILFGPETPVLYGAPGPDKHCLNSNLICSPCVNVYNHRESPCRQGICLSQIKPEIVFQKVKDCLSA
ncbi:glycosyltransferase family 9 protein [Candidatus Omnitrophota bacterium]